MSKIICPHCDSSNVQSLMMVYQSGISTGKSVGSYSGGTYNIGDGSFNPVFGNISSSTTSQTFLAQKYSPPYIKNEEDAGNKAFTTTMIALSILAITFTYCFIKQEIGIIAIIGGCLFILSAIVASIAWGNLPKAKRLDNLAKKQLNIWEKSFLCFTCGRTFTLDSTGEISNTPNQP